MRSVGGLPPWLRGELGTGRIVSATEMSDCIGEGAWLLVGALLAVDAADTGPPDGGARVTRTTLPPRMCLNTRVSPCLGATVCVPSAPHRQQHTTARGGVPPFRRPSAARP